MKTNALRSGTTRLLVILGLTLSAAAHANAQDITVITAGAFQTAYREPAPAYERATQNRVATLVGSTASATAIQNRLERGEAADVLILADDAIAELIRRGTVVPGSRVQLVRSNPSVPFGAKRPDAARDLIRFFASSVASIIQGTGLEALTAP